MPEFVPCHKSLMLGSKRDLPRATRLVYLEICLLARDMAGVLPLSKKRTPVQFLQDILGGDSDEVAVAIPALVDEGMITICDNVLLVTNFDEWQIGGVTPSSGAERVRRHRAKLRAAKYAHCNGATTEDPTPISENRNESVTVTFVEESRVEENKKRERVEPVTLSPEEKFIVSELTKCADLWPDADVVPTATRITAAILDEPRAKGQSKPIMQETLAYVREQRASYPLATPEQLLARAEKKVVWVLGDIRKGSRKLSQAPPDMDRVLLDDARQSAQRADAEQKARANKADKRERVAPEAIGTALKGLIKRVE